MIRSLTFLSLLLMMLISNSIQSQVTITGHLFNSSNHQPVSNANVKLSGSLQGTTSDANGRFSLTSNFSTDTLTFSALGYVAQSLVIIAGDSTKIDVGELFLTDNAISLDEVNIIATYSTERRSPLTISNIPQRKLTEQLGDQPFPDVLKMTPGVYSTRTGGGSGDAVVTIRGFQSENVGLLLNGIPISSVENGLIYWNNWTGLADVTRAIQVQRGLGASNVALNSVGGTINIITKTTEVEEGGFLEYSATSYGNAKMSLGLSSGLMENGFAVNFLGSRTQGDGYIDATYVDAWAYFLTVAKTFNPKHKLVMTALGAPERHGQRNLKLSKEEIDRNGLKFNKDWGSYNGKINNASENFYHKPWITLNHYWSISPELFIASSLYISPGSGGGKWSDAYGWNTPSIFEYRNPSGQIDWNAIYQNNATHFDSAILSNGQVATGFSKNVQTHFLASHNWNGFLSRMEFKASKSLKYTLGIHLRQFRSELKQTVEDLLGGDFYIDNYAWAVDGLAGRSEIKTVGDIIKVYNGAKNPSGTLFGQINFDEEKINTFISASLTSTWYQRWDRYNYVNDIYSDVIRKNGFDVKAGINYKISESIDIYTNGGYFSRAPYYKYVFGNFTNVPTQGIANEKVLSAEAGIRYLTGKTQAGINYYYTIWEDKNFLSNEYIQLENNSSTRALVTGLDALHMGLEAEINHQFCEVFRAGWFVSAGNWKWRNDVSAVLFNDNNVAVDTVNVYANGLNVGGSPQFQTGLTGDLVIFERFNLSANWIFNDLFYANFDPALRTSPADRSQAYRIPGYSTLDVHLGYPFSLFKQPARFGVSCFNALNSKHIIQGEDGTDHTIETFRGFWDFGRTFSFSLRMNLG